MNIPVSFSVFLAKANIPGLFPPLSSYISKNIIFPSRRHSCSFRNFLFWSKRSLISDKS